MDITTGALGSLLPKLSKFLLMDEYNFPKSVRRNVRILVRELKSIDAALHKVAQVPRDQLDPHAKIWAAEIRELSYDMEDAVDDIMVRSEPSFGKMTDSFRKLKVKRQLGSLIIDMMTKMEEIAARRDRYRIDGLVANPYVRYKVDNVVATPPPTVTDLIGIEGPRDELIQMLAEGGGILKNQMKILSIVGSGGLGKTALASMVYQELQVQFHCLAFVSIGLKPDMKKIFMEMAHLLAMENYVDIPEEEKLMDKIRDYLQNKRFLIVIDDLWNKQDWDKIVRSLPVSDCGSIVITTTRVNSMAEICCSGSKKLIYEIRHLGYLNAKRLFLKRCFDSDEANCPDALTEAVDEVLKMCGGMPLAILSIASLLTSRVTSKESWQDRINSIYSAWKEMLSSLQSPREDIPGLENLRRILSKSCVNLPGNLKTCLLYLAMSAKEQSIERDTLVSKWIAEGFIPEEEGSILEESAACYFDDLINRNVIQPVEYGNCLGKGTYEVSYMMLYVLRLISHYEQFVTFLSDFGISGPDVIPIRLCIQSSGSEHSVDTEKMDLSQVRSITVLGVAKSVSFKLQNLQVLDIDGCEDLDNTDVDLICRMNLLKYLSLKQTKVTVLPPQIGSLRYLEYLDVRRTQIINLPSQIGKLQNLKTLDVRQTQVKELPRELIQLPKLAHLLFGQCTLHGGTKLPVGSNLPKSVKKLGIVDSRECSEVIMEEISKLSKVMEIEVVLYDGPADKEQNDRLLSSIGKCSKLQSLTIYGDSNPSDELPARSVFPRLEKLKVDGRFAKVPRWIQTLEFLNLLDMRVYRLEPNALRILGKLPRLSSLALALVALPREQVIITKDAGFLELEVFTFDCRVPWVTFELEAMPSLKHIRLKVYACKAGKTPLGIIHLRNLNKVTLRYSSQYACSHGVMETVAVMKRAAASHANLIVLLINDSYEIFRSSTWDGQEIFPSNTYIDRDIIETEIKELDSV